jgi:tyrosyl-tRNA synthetase
MHLYKEKTVTLQMGGSDQWGTTGTELVRRKEVESLCFDLSLITKADGTKFGKSEGGNIWLDAKRTSPYKFYQYWLNTSMQMLRNTLRYFFLTKEVIELNSRTQRSSTLTYFAKRLAEEVTTMAHSALT